MLALKLIVEIVSLLLLQSGVCLLEAGIERFNTPNTYSTQQHRVPKMLPLFPVEHVKNCSIIHYFNSTGMYKNKNLIF